MPLIHHWKVQLFSGLMCVCTGTVGRGNHVTSLNAWLSIVVAKVGFVLVFDARAVIMHAGRDWYPSCSCREFYLQGFNDDDTC